jgi:hypothetical protein
VPYNDQRLGTLVPGIVREVGDVAHLAALSAPRPVVLQALVDGTGARLPDVEHRPDYMFTRAAYDRVLAADRLVLGATADGEAVARLLRR